MASLIRREFSAYFVSPIAYVVLVVFLAVNGVLFALILQQLTAHGPQGIEFPTQLLLGSKSYVEAHMQDWRFLLAFLLMWVVFLAIPPLLTMRLFAEERSTGTLEMLMTAPLLDWQVVLSKYLGCLGFYLVLWLPTLFYIPVLLYAGNDIWPVFTSYVGVATAGAMFLALGLFVSSLVRSQIVSFLVSLFLSLVFIVVGVWRPEGDTTGPLVRFLSYFSVPQHFDRDFSRGILDSRHLILYLSVTVFCLFLTVRSLESRRWR
jgi:ABC-2 type transport system permease protein